LDGLKRGGYRLVYTETPTAYFTAIEAGRKATDLTYSLGVTLNREAEITAVLWDGPAFEAGLTVASKVLAVNGFAYDPDRLKLAITQAKDGKPIDLIVRDGDHIGPVQIHYKGGLRYPRLERASGPDLLGQILQARPK
jgi:predicted metalloprotease with PDZ domain